MKKSKINVIIKEALEVGGWELSDQKTNYETFSRPNQTVEISVHPMRTDPESYIFTFEDHRKHTKITSTDVINSLCSRLAKKLDRE